MPRNPKLNQQMRSESRQKILWTARALFSERGFFNVRIADIAAQAGMSPGNIYWYFTRKEEILAAILKDYFNAYEQTLLEAKAEPGDALEKVMRLVQNQIAILDAFEENVNIYMSILGHGGVNFLKSLGIDSAAAGARLHEHLCAILEAAMREGVIPPQDPQLLAVFFFSFFNGLIITYGRGWKRFPQSAIGREALRLLGYPGEYTPIQP